MEGVRRRKRDDKEASGQNLNGSEVDSDDTVISLYLLFSYQLGSSRLVRKVGLTEVVTIIVIHSIVGLEISLSLAFQWEWVNGPLHTTSHAVIRTSRRLLCDLSRALLAKRIEFRQLSIQTQWTAISRVPGLQRYVTCTSLIFTLPYLDFVSMWYW